MVTHLWFIFYLSCFKSRISKNTRFPQQRACKSRTPMSALNRFTNTVIEFCRFLLVHVLSIVLLLRNNHYPLPLETGLKYLHLLIKECMHVQATRNSIHCLYVANNGTPVIAYFVEIFIMLKYIWILYCLRKFIVSLLVHRSIDYWQEFNRRSVELTFQYWLLHRKLV